MSVEGKLLTLKSEIKKGFSVLDKITNYYNTYLENEFDPDAKRTDHAIVISDLICNYYTCLETIFFRISQYFENELLTEKWHQDLLQKMTLQIDGVRSAVITEKTYNILLELLKFRHFKRYYFDFNYDWDKLIFIQKKFRQAISYVNKNLTEFLSFLDNIQRSKL